MKWWTWRDTAFVGGCLLLASALFATSAWILAGGLR